MNDINRRGQKVVCILEFELISYDGRIYQGPQPVFNEVYTVNDFVDNSGNVVPSCPVHGDMRPGIELCEIAPPLHRKSTGQPIRFGWPILGFRPADERETDISELREIAARSTPPRIPETAE